MNRERFRALVLIPFAGIFLILLACAFAIPKSSSTGLWMPVLKLRTSHEDATCDGRWVFVLLMEDGKVEVNSEPVPIQNLSAMIGKLMETRAERVVYLVPSPNVPYFRFIETLELLQMSASDVHVGVLSETMRREYFGSPLKRMYLPCDIVWPLKEFRKAE